MSIKNGQYEKCTNISLMDKRTKGKKERRKGVWERETT